MTARPDLERAVRHAIGQAVRPVINAKGEQVDTVTDPHAFLMDLEALGFRVVEREA